MVRNIEKFIKRFFWLPFLVGFIGYFTIGKYTFWECVYGSAALYFVNPIFEDSNAFILFAEITAIVATTGLILSAISAAIEALNHIYIQKFKDSTAVYTDNEWGQDLVEELHHGYLGRVTGKGRLERTRHHIIMYGDDLTNINFYTEHKDFLKNKRTFVMLNHVDSFLLQDTHADDVHYFNMYELMARIYWKKYNLYDQIVRHQDLLRIAIIGYGQVGEAILRYGFLNNIYTLDQKVEYHVWGCDLSQKEYLEGLNTMNSDRLVIHEAWWKSELNLLAEMDRIIVTDVDTIDVVQELLRKSAVVPIHCYNSGSTKMQELLAFDNLTTFGDMKTILTEDCIKNESLLRLGKLFNYDYCLRVQTAGKTEDYQEEMEAQWRKLNGFFRGSNIARGDHYWIEKRMEKDGFSDEEIKEVEHIRWCRYYFFNGWTYSPNRDDAKRVHNNLVPYRQLSTEDQNKDGFFCQDIKKEIDEETYKGLNAWGCQDDR